MASSKFKVVHLILIFITFFHSSLGVFSATVEKLFVPSPGLETSVFDSSGVGLYTGVADGQILKYNKSRNDFDFYAVTAPNRPEAICNGRVTSLLASKCGRPLGMAFYNLTNQLFVADASLGLFVIPPGGGQGILLANGANGTSFRFTDAVDIDQLTGNVYFVYFSSTCGINDIVSLVSIHDSTGRLLKYDPSTKQNVAGNPDNVKIASSGDFWVGVTTTPLVQLRGIKIDGFGNVLQTLSFNPEFQSPTIADVQEYGDALFLGSPYGPYLGLYRP